MLGQVLIAALLVVGSLVAALGAWMASREPRGGDPFVPYLVLLGAAPLFALASTVGVGALRASGVQPLRKVGKGYHEVSVVRPSRVLRNAAAAALACFALVGLVAFGAYLREPGAVSGLAVLALLAWLLVLAFFARIVVARTLTDAVVEDARVFVRPASPQGDAPFHVRVEQKSRGGPLRSQGILVTLVGDRHTRRLRGGKLRTRVDRVFRERREAVAAVQLEPGQAASGECVFSVPAGTLAAPDSVVVFRIEVRTRLRGPDYRGGFPLP